VTSWVKVAPGLGLPVTPARRPENQIVVRNYAVAVNPVDWIIQVAGTVAYITMMVLGVPFAGFGTLVSLSLLLFGVLFLLLGLMSEYIGMIYEEVRGRPSFIVRRAHGLEPVARVVRARREHHQLAVLGRCPCAQHRAVDEDQAELPGDLDGALHAVHADRGALQPERARRGIGLPDDLDRRVGVEHHGEDDAGAGGRLGGRAAGLGTGVQARSQALAATAVAEYFREQGKRVLLLVDSLTRVARAQREGRAGGATR